MTKRQKTIKKETEEEVKKIEKKLVFKGTEVVIFEGGYWMKREDYDKFFPKNKVSSPSNIFLDVDKSTHQIRVGYFPSQWLKENL